MDGNKINIINFIFPVCCFLSKDINTRGRSYPSIGGKVAVALLCLTAGTL